MQCGTCGRENASDAAFCSGCGGRLVAPERIKERKVVSVLFADLVGFTSRSERLDVEDVHGTLAPFHASLRHVLESFGGTVEKFIGDAVMAVFGAPIAHEDDAERAVRAGLAIRDALAQLGDDLHVRIGINTGEALVSVGADPQSGEGMVAGDVVNTAARLQSAAPVDGILVGEVTYRSAEREIVFEPHPPIDAKGKTEPVVCWTALEPRSFAPIGARESLPFVGRERERRMLVDAFEHCRAQRSVQLITIVGVPGIGKSRLVAELARYVEADPHLTRWRNGHVLSYGSGVAFFALAEVVKQECGILDSDNVRAAATKLDAAIVSLGLEGADARWVRNQVGPLVGMDAASDGSGQSEAFAGWRLLFEAMAAESPTVLVVDDLHWADDALLDFIDSVVDRVTDVPLLVVATARPELLERRPAWAGGKLNALTIGLDPLSSEHTTALIGEIIDRSLLSIDAEATLLERAGGNPLYAQEYVRALVERGASAELPETVQGIIAARLDGLSTEEKGLLQDAAVIGATAWLGAVCALGERDRELADDLTVRLERKQLVRRARRSSIAGEVELSFTHALIREVAYSQLPRAARAERHQRAATWLERVATDRGDTAELIAHHYTTVLELETALGNDTDALRPAALNALTVAVRQAAAKHDHSAAIRYADTALRLRPEPRLRAELLVLRAVAGYTAGHPDESVLLEARDDAVVNGRTEDAVQLTCALSEWAEYYAADAERSSGYDAEALRLAADLPPGPIATIPAYFAAYRLHLTGRYDEVIELANIEIARALDTGADSAVGLMLIWRGAARAVTTGDAGIIDLLEAVRILDEQAHPKATIAVYNLGEVLQGLGRLGEAMAAFEAAKASARRSGNGPATSMAEMGLASLAYHRGESAAARAMLERIPSDMSEWLTSNASNARGRLLLEEAPQESADAARIALAYGRGSANVEVECNALALAALAALAVGDRSTVDTALDEFIEMWTLTGGNSSCMASLVEAGLALVARGRHQELAAAADLLRVPTPWGQAAHALAEHRYADAAAILGSIPSIPLRDAALRLAASG
jgi:class 3 adenylate cyclase/tetratricopeptide (TPR) repeat protein